MFILAVWVLHYSATTPGPLRRDAVPAAAALILAASSTPELGLVTGLVLSGLIGAAGASTSPRR